VNTHLSRRSVLELAGGLVLSCSPVGKVAAIENLLGQARSTGPEQVDSWLSVGTDGTVTAFTGKIDMGTGIATAFAQIIADELDVDFDRVNVVMGDTARTPDQAKSTASQSIVTGAQPLKVAAAEARATLLRLAAQRWGVPAADLRTRRGAVHKSGPLASSISYAELLTNGLFSVELQIDRQTPWGPLLKIKAPFKAVAEYSVVGTSIPRTDVPAKVAGTFEFVQNVRIPDMLHGRVVRPPAIGARLVNVDETSVRGIGSVRVVRRNDFLGVVAEREEDAIEASMRLKAEWTTTAATLPNRGDLYEALRRARVVSEIKGPATGNVDAELGGARFRVKADYDFPFQCHGMIGPSCAVADVRGDQATIWSGSQWPQGDRSDLAKMLGLPFEKVRLVWHEASGSYGRLGCDDAAADAAVLSQAVGRPVRVQWTRQDEHGWEPVSPAMTMTLECGADESGRIVALDYVQYSSSHATGEKGNHLAWRLLGTAPGHGRMSGDATRFWYGTRSARLRNVFVEPWLRAIYLRAPGGQQSIFAYESIVDELAVAAGIDPLEFRLRNVADDRDRAVLQTVARLSNWRPRDAAARSSRPAVATGRGVAMARYGAGESRLAAVADVDVETAIGKISVKNVFMALDIGLIINPDGVLNQAEGGLLQGISRTIHEQVTFDNEKITSVDWAGYPILRFSELPDVKIELLRRSGLPASAVGEVGNVVATAVIANALFDAVGKRFRRVPFVPEVVKAAL
jgi:nicotinate dehydrogenase subunit B